MRWAVEQITNPAMREQVERKLANGAPAPRTVVQGRNPPPPPQENKYHAKRVRADGHNFASKWEYAEYRRLCIRQRAGEIFDLRVHVKFALFDPGGTCRGEFIGTYTADFVYHEQGVMKVADAKSVATKRRREWPRTKKLMRACHGIEVLELMKGRKVGAV